MWGWVVVFVVGAGAWGLRRPIRDAAVWLTGTNIVSAEPTMPIVRDSSAPKGSRESS